MAEFLFTLAAAIVFVPLSIVTLKLLRSLDREDVDATTMARRAQNRSWPRRFGSTFGWIALGCAIPVTVGMYYPRPEVWFFIALYVLINLLGTLMGLRELKTRPRATRVLKALFVFQIPTGIVFVIANGL